MSSPRGPTVNSVSGAAMQVAQNITIEQLYQNGDTSNERKFLTAQIVIMQPEYEEDERVKKMRRRIVLSDKSSSILAFVMTKKMTRIVEGECIFLSNFRVSYKAIIIHDKTKISK